MGMHIDEDQTWSTNTLLVKKTQQGLFFLMILRKNQLTQKFLESFYHCSIESILTYCICVWFASCTAVERKVLQKVVTKAQKIFGCPLSSPWKYFIVPSDSKKPTA